MMKRLLFLFSLLVCLAGMPVTDVYKRQIQAKAKMGEY